MCCISLDMHFLQSLQIYQIFIIKIPRYFLSYFWSKILSSSLLDMLKLSKTTSPPKLFRSDCITLYHEIRNFSRAAAKGIYKMFFNKILFCIWFVEYMLHCSLCMHICLLGCIKFFRCFKAIFPFFSRKFFEPKTFFLVHIFPGPLIFQAISKTVDFREF